MTFFKVENHLLEKFEYTTGGKLLRPVSRNNSVFLIQATVTLGENFSSKLYVDMKSKDWLFVCLNCWGVVESIILFFMGKRFSYIRDLPPIVFCFVSNPKMVSLFLFSSTFSTKNFVFVTFNEWIIAGRCYQFKRFHKHWKLILFHESQKTLVAILVNFKVNIRINYTRTSRRE